MKSQIDLLDHGGGTSKKKDLDAGGSESSPPLSFAAAPLAADVVHRFGKNNDE
jgi:hypothetical protein